MLKDVEGNTISFRYDCVLRDIPGYYFGSGTNAIPRERTICRIEIKIQALQMEGEPQQEVVIGFESFVVRHYKDKQNKEAARRAALKKVLEKSIAKKHRRSFWLLYFSRSERSFDIYTQVETHVKEDSHG